MTTVAGLPDVVALVNGTRAYAWGSPTVLPELLGDEPTGEPVAELWIGAHPGQPSHVDAGETRIGLDALVAADPVGLLGPAVVDRFGARLPFLLKLLAAERALSLQVHPDLAQAREGFARENAAGVPVGAVHRNYQDDNHKPELLCALTPFEALCGFRAPATSAAALAAFGVPELGPLLDVLHGATDLRAAVEYLLAVPEASAPALVAAAAAGATRLLATAPDSPYAADAALLVDLARQSPDETGPVVALLLNLVRLEPGEAVFLAAGQIHAYVRGFGVELLANSDNVLRCGLTPKHVDGPELLRVASFDPVPAAPWPSTPVAGGSRYPVPVDDFELSRLDLTPRSADLRSPGPQLLAATAGRVVVRGGDAEVTLDPGRAVFVPAGRPVTVAGPGTVFRAVVGPAVTG